MIAFKPPAFWWHSLGWQAALFSPIALAYNAIACWRLSNGKRARVGVPVLCIGNFTVGGGGKTPTALALGHAAQQLGLKPGFLSCGYGGSHLGPVLVEQHHSAALVGDEALLLAAVAPTVVADDRRLAAKFLIETGVDFIIMDDGFQSAGIAFDYALLVIDADRGFGNGMVFPAGPLRAQISQQVQLANAVLLIGEGSVDIRAIEQNASADMPVFKATLRPHDPEHFRGRRVLAFAGIANPGKFYRSLCGIGADVVVTRDFPDHHSFTETEMRRLLEAAEHAKLSLVTTRKDAVRIDQTKKYGCRLASVVEVLDVGLAFGQPGLASNVIGNTQANHRK
ncbi:tetraacyldisaccharide 4'-kinase [Aureimonas glaciei]|nr:tetraacyldisaccharide 4'-kinase [Aureimonas glaciei]